MKRRIILLAVLALVASLAIAALAGCGNSGKQAAIDAYKQASAATASAKSADYDMTYDFTASYSGVSMTGGGDARLQYVFPDNMTDFDKIQFALDFNMNFDMMAQKLQMESGTYLKDGNVYIFMDSNQGTMPTMKTYFSLTDVLEGALKDVVGVSAKDLDLEKLLKEIGLDKLLANFDFQKMIESSNNQINVEKYIVGGSFDGTTIKLDIDIMGLIKDAVTIAAQQSGGGLENVLPVMSQLDKAITKATCTITATVDEHMMFTSSASEITMDIDAAALAGSSAMPAGNSSTMTVTMNVNCPTIKTNTVTAVDYPSLKGYTDITEDVKKGVSEMLAQVISQLMSGETPAGSGSVGSKL